MISIVCCYNDKIVLDEYLLSSLRDQESDFELILLDNTNNKYSSAAAALNEGVDKASGKYLMIVHQDIKISDSRFLNKLIDYIDGYDSDTIFGLAGIKESGKIYSNIKHGENSEYVSENRIIEPEEVQTVDEMLIAGNTSLFKTMKFDEKTCDNWHLYGVDLCLSVKLKGGAIYTLPLEVYHKSAGILSKGYYTTARNLSKKYRKNYEVIYTTCINFNTSPIRFNLRLFFIKLKTLLKEIITRSANIFS